MKRLPLVFQPRSKVLRATFLKLYTEFEASRELAGPQCSNALCHFRTCRRVTRHVCLSRHGDPEGPSRGWTRSAETLQGQSVLSFGCQPRVWVLFVATSAILLDVGSLLFQCSILTLQHGQTLNRSNPDCVS